MSLFFFIFSVILGEHSGIHFDTVVCDAARLSVRTNMSKDGWIDWWIDSKLLILSQCSSITLVLLCILDCVTKWCVTMYQFCLSDMVCTEAERVGEGFWPCAAPWQATKASCMDPGCRATHRWCKNQQGQQLVWEHLRWTSLRVHALRKTVAEDCCDWINHLWAEAEHTDHDEELQNIYTQHLRLLPMSFLKHVLSHLNAKKDQLKKFHHSLTS